MGKEREELREHYFVMQVQERLMKMRHLVKDNVEKSQRAQSLVSKAPLGSKIDIF
jgi:hypothetical protein